MDCIRTDGMCKIVILAINSNRHHKNFAFRFGCCRCLRNCGQLIFTLEVEMKSDDISILLNLLLVVLVSVYNSM